MKQRRLIHNLKSGGERRRQLRKNLTPAEALLWTNLRNLNWTERNFVDNTEVIVELDGARHTGLLEVERDDRRTRFLEKFGIRVVRFENKEVFENLEAVLEAIRAVLRGDA